MKKMSEGLSAEAERSSAALDAWKRMSPEDKLLHGIVYRRRYEEALEYQGVTDAPAWEELTHEQREAVRQETIRYTQELNEGFGKFLAQDSSE